MDEPDFRVEIWTIQLSSQAWSAPKWTPQNCKWCAENGVLATVMECFRVWVFSLFEHKLLGGIGGSHDFFCAGLSNPEVAVVLPLSYLPCPSILDRQAVYDCVWSRGLRFFSGRWGFQNVAQLNQKQFKGKLRVNIRGKVFPHCNYEWRSHIWPDRLVFSTLYQPWSSSH